LREQLSPFDIDLRSVERQLDFSDAGRAVSRFLANRNRRLFSMSTENALVTLLREGVSINEEDVDSKRDLEEALRQACNDFINHSCNSMAKDVLEIAEKHTAVKPEALANAKFFEANHVKDILTKTSERVEVQAGEMTAQMKLYLDNPATQSILLKPISRKISKGLEEIRKGVSGTTDGANGWEDDARGEIMLLIDEVENKVKMSAKAAR
jgi:thiamine phosphate synthase YjbQ (UPF0047 family)